MAPSIGQASTRAPNPCSNNSSPSVPSKNRSASCALPTLGPRPQKQSASRAPRLTWTMPSIPLQDVASATSSMPSSKAWKNASRARRGRSLRWRSALSRRSEKRNALLGRRSESRNVMRGRSRDRKSEKSVSASERGRGNGPGRVSAQDHGSGPETATAPGCVIGLVHTIAVTETEIGLAIAELAHGHATVQETAREIDIDDAVAGMIAEDVMKRSKKSSQKRNFPVLRRRLWQICFETANAWLPSNLNWKLTRSSSHRLERLCLHRPFSPSAETVLRLQRSKSRSRLCPQS